MALPGACSARGVQCQGYAVPGASTEQHTAVLQNMGSTSQVLLSHWPNWINGSVALLLKSDSNNNKALIVILNRSLYIAYLFTLTWFLRKMQELESLAKYFSEVYVLIQFGRAKLNLNSFSFEGVCVVWQRHPGLRGVHSHAYVAHVADIRISS